jgi:hypothetical protein
MAPKPNPDMDERVVIPLDPEAAISALPKVDPEADPGETPQSSSPSATSVSAFPRATASFGPI